MMMTDNSQTEAHKMADDEVDLLKHNLTRLVTDSPKKNGVFKRASILKEALTMTSMLKSQRHENGINIAISTDGSDTN